RSLPLERVVPGRKRGTVVDLPANSPERFLTCRGFPDPWDAFHARTRRPQKDFVLSSRVARPCVAVARHGRTAVSSCGSARLCDSTTAIPDPLCGPTQRGFHS